jgi:hypothetical protein
MITKPRTEEKPPQRQKSAEAVKPKKKGEQSPTDAARSDVPDEGEQPVGGDTANAKDRS